MYYHHPTRCNPGELEASGATRVGTSVAVVLGKSRAHQASPLFLWMLKATHKTVYKTNFGTFPASPALEPAPFPC